MSYCRFSEGDVYMYPDMQGGITCCACRLAQLIPSIFTTGLDSNDSENILGLELEECHDCLGQGCEKCMIHDDSHFTTFDDAIAHLRAHRDCGDIVPEGAFLRLAKEKAEGKSLLAKEEDNDRRQA